MHGKYSGSVHAASALEHLVISCFASEKLNSVLGTSSTVY